MMKSRIRPMEPEDRKQVVDILETTPEFTRGEVDTAVELTDIYLRRGTDSGYHVLVLDEDSEISGYICYGPTPLTESTWDIYWIAVDSGKRGRGAGKKLMKETEENITRAGGKLILIETSSKPGYEKTRFFYDSLEYEQTAYIPDFYAPGDGKLILQKRI